jgi:hypothetical protein
MMIYNEPAFVWTFLGIYLIQRLQSFCWFNDSSNFLYLTTPRI